MAKLCELTDDQLRGLVKNQLAGMERARWQIEELTALLNESTAEMIRRWGSDETNPTPKEPHP